MVATTSLFTGIRTPIGLRCSLPLAEQNVHRGQMSEVRSPWSRRILPTWCRSTLQ